MKTSQITYQLMISKSRALVGSLHMIPHPHHTPIFHHFLHLETRSLSGICVTDSPGFIPQSAHSLSVRYHLYDNESFKFYCKSFRIWSFSLKHTLSHMTFSLIFPIGIPNLVCGKMFSPNSFQTYGKDTTANILLRTE